MCPIFPRPLERVAHAAVVVQLETVLGERWPGDVPAEPLEPCAVAPVDRDLRMHVDAPDLGQRICARRLGQAHGTSELARARAGLLTQKLHVARGGRVARGEHGLIAPERVIYIVDAFERATVSLEHTHQAPVGRGGDLHHVLRGRLA